MLSFLRHPFYTMSPWKALYARLFFSQSTRLEIFNKMIPFLEDGVDLYSLINLLAEEYETLSKYDVRGMVLREWAEAMIRADSFSTAAKPWISITDYTTLSTGEDGGQLVKDSMKNIVQANEDVSLIKSTIVGALTYPAVLLLVLIGIMTLSSIKMIPTLTEIMPYDGWPAIAKQFYDFTYFFSSNWYIFIFGLALAFYAIGRSFNQWSHISRSYVEPIPPYRQFKAISSAIFLISLGSLMRTGMPAYDAIKSISDNSSPYVKAQLSKSLSLLANGRQLGEALNTNFMPLETGMDIRIYAQATDATKSMDRIGRNAIKNTISGIGAVSKAVAYLTMFTVAMYMIWMIVSFQSVAQALKASMPM